MKDKLTAVFSLRSWIIYTEWGWFLGVAFILLLSALLDAAGIEGKQFYLGMGMGGGVSLAQWWRFRKSLPLTNHWVTFGFIGMGLPGLLVDVLLLELPGQHVFYAIPLGALGAGLLQYRLLKRHFTAGNWIPVSLLGWIAATATVFSIDYTRFLQLPNLWTALLNLLLILVGGVVLGWISGVFLKRMVHPETP